MPNAVWPPSLPQRAELADYEEIAVDNVVRSQMAVGFKARLRDTKEVRQFTLAIRLSPAQMETLRAFYRDTLAHGSLPFDHVEWRDGATARTYKFLAPPQVRAVAPNRFRVLLRLVTA